MSKRRVVLWADERQLPMINLALRAGGFEVAACGSDSADDAPILSERLGAPQVHDLRTTLAFENADAAWIASLTVLSREHLEIIRRVGRPVLASLPVPSPGRQDSAAAAMELVPLLRRSEAVHGGADLLQRDEPWSAVHVSLNAPAEALTLPSLLYSALDFIYTYSGRVESIAASLAGASSVPETLAGLTGHLSAHLQLDHGRAATMLISDRAGDWRRRVDLLAADAHLTITDRGSQLHYPGGAVDEDHTSEDTAFGSLIGREIRRILDGAALDPPPDHPRLIMLCETVLLACRTGQAESPRTVERMSEHV